MIREIDQEQNVAAWRVYEIQTGRGFGMKMGPDGSDVRDFIAASMHCEDLPAPGNFVMSPELAEEFATALLEEVRRYREGEPL